MVTVTVQRKFALFSATRQWNPGDEFILSGSRRIIGSALGDVDAILYDRNPDVRPSDGTTVGYRHIRRPISEEAGEAYERLSARLRLGFFSNSVKFDSDVSYASFAVMAGSPEWATPRCWNFYDHVLRNGLPLLGLGLGSMPAQVPAFVHAALDKAVVRTTRSKSLAASDLARRHDISYLPCPALLSAPAPRRVDRVRRVGVAIGVAYEHAVWANGLDAEFYDRVCRSLDELFARFGDEVEFDLVAHYIDEIPILKARFPGRTVRYSFDSADYYDIFADYDLVVSTRVHACGAAASLGIPSISLGHDYRSDTTDGFLSESVLLSDDAAPLVYAFEALAGEASERSRTLAAHRSATLDEYVRVVRSAMSHTPDRVEYDPGAVVPFADAETEAATDGAHLSAAIEAVAPLARDLRSAQRANDDLRAALAQVESSKAEMAAELDGAREAVRRLQTELDEARASRPDQSAPVGGMATLRRTLRRR